mmetsp:Transcript_2497/g.6529  ORF Transcript_2497/g.6529 Transcript_2497/m.6529 type:complete len:200 (+) Transcript_2497:2801-3400(+)
MFAGIDRLSIFAYSPASLDILCPSPSRSQNCSVKNHEANTTNDTADSTTYETCKYIPARVGLRAPTACPTSMPSTRPCMRTPVHMVQRSDRADADRASAPTWPSRAVSVVFIPIPETIATNIGAASFSVSQASSSAVLRSNSPLAAPKISLLSPATSGILDSTSPFLRSESVSTGLSFKFGSASPCSSTEPPPCLSLPL